jgi:WD40 repeat protein
MAGAEHRRVSVRNVATGRRIFDLAGDGVLLDAAWSPDGRRILTHHVGGTVILWDATNGTRVATIPGSAGPHDKAFEFAPDSSTFVVDLGKGGWELRQSGGGQSLWQLGTAVPRRFSFDGSCLLIDSGGGTYAVVESKTGRKLEELTIGAAWMANASAERRLVELGFPGLPWSWPASADGRYVLRRDSPTGLITVATRERVSGRLVRRLRPSEQSLHGAEFSTDGTRSAGVDGINVYVWETDKSARTHQATPTFSPHEGRWSPDGARLLLYCAGGSFDHFDIWDKDLRHCEASIDQERGEEANGSINATWAGPTRLITTDSGGGVAVWAVRRPVAWWGIAWLWEFWGALILVALAVSMVVRDLKRWFSA